MLWQNNANLSVLHKLIVINMIDQSHLEHIVASLVEQILIHRHIVANCVVCLPSAEQRESWSQLELDRVSVAILFAWQS